MGKEAKLRAERLAHWKAEAEAAVERALTNPGVTVYAELSEDENGETYATGIAYIRFDVGLLEAITVRPERAAYAFMGAAEMVTLWEPEMPSGLPVFFKDADALLDARRRGAGLYVPPVTGNIRERTTPSNEEAR